MIRVSKNNIFMAVRDENQLSAFLNNGWTKVEEKQSEKVASSIPVVEEVKAFNHSKTEINRMSTEQLRKLATETSVENGETMTGAELKEYFIKTYNL